MSPVSTNSVEFGAQGIIRFSDRNGRVAYVASVAVMPHRAQSIGQGMLLLCTLLYSCDLFSYVKYCQFGPVSDKKILKDNACRTMTECDANKLPLSE